MVGRSGNVRDNTGQREEKELGLDVFEDQVMIHKIER